MWKALVRGRKAADSSIARPDVIGLVNTLRSDGHEVMANRVDVVF
jgi:hypothetical protein